jgi:hypothetical protein
MKPRFAHVRLVPDGSGLTGESAEGTAPRL